LDKATVSEDTPDQRKKFRREVGGWLTSGCRIPVDLAAGTCGLRRGISLWLVDDFAKEQRGMEEGGEGSL
jgi:hypothetical protein